VLPPRQGTARAQPVQESAGPAGGGWRWDAAAGASGAAADAREAHRELRPAHRVLRPVRSVWDVNDWGRRGGTSTKIGDEVRVSFCKSGRWDGLHCWM
jgi:hypothetical protein